MTLFRNVVFIAALTGLLASVAMTAMQMFTTVPLILQAESPKTPAAQGTSAPFRRRAAGGGPAHEHDAKPGSRPTASARHATLLANARHRRAILGRCSGAGGIGGCARVLFWGWPVTVRWRRPRLPPGTAPPAADCSATVWWATAALPLQQAGADRVPPSPMLPLGRADRGAAYRRRAAAGQLRDADPRRLAPSVRGRRDHDQSGVLGHYGRSGRSDPAALLRLVGKPALELCLRRQA